MKDIRIERGDIFYVNSFVPTVGCEQRPGRPGVIVSNDANNRASRTVEIVYCTTREKPNLPTHTIIHSTAVESTVLCEQITTISIDCIGTYIGRCTAAEMEAIDKCLIESIGLTLPSKSKQTLECSVKGNQDDESKKLQDDMYKIKVELDTYKRMYEIAVNKLATARIEGKQKR